MKVISYHCAGSGSNVFICGPDGGGMAAIIDPGPCMEDVVRLLALHNYEIAAILVTCPSETLVHPIRTLSRLYPLNVYAGCDRVGDVLCTNVSSMDHVDVGELRFTVIPVRPHTRYSIMYGAREVFFTGPIIHAGTIGETTNEYAEELLVSLVKRTLGEFGEGSVLMPAFGPATTLRAELNLNPHFRRTDHEIHY